jgi:tRNA(adenine34) deaminase
MPAQEQAPERGTEDQDQPCAQDIAYMHLALDEARLAFGKGEIPVGAVAVYQDQVIARGHNCKESQQDPTGHAEMIVLRNAARARGGWRLLGVTLYCTMEPCPMCAGAMIQARLPRLVYAVDDPKAGAAGSIVDLLHHPRLNHHVQVTRGVMATEMGAMLDQFFSGLRSGQITRYSRAWQARQLAEKQETV